jgi:geranylgeranyl diphosphate synthase type II
MSMDLTARIEQALETSVAGAVAAPCPAGLAGALQHAVFPGGARLRPRLVMAVAWACGDDEPDITDAAAASIELLHCASLVHDDLPCFDDASERRGKPSVHRAFGEPIGVLTGDALIVLAFETLAKAVERRPARLAPLVRTIAACVGAPAGITAGQAWESESLVSLEDYHRAKTGALFAGATMAGAIAAGSEGEPWRMLGERLGLAYQVADDIRDVASSPQEIGKPVGRDEVLGRANAVHELGLQGAVHQLDRLLAQAVDAIPACPGAPGLRALIAAETRSFLPKRLQRLSA